MTRAFASEAGGRGAGFLSELLAGLQFPGANDRVFDGICVPGLDVGDDHHVLRVALRHRERLGERMQEEVSEVE
jgi:hypothetical protein